MLLLEMMINGKLTNESLEADLIACSSRPLLHSIMRSAMDGLLVDGSLFEKRLGYSTREFLLQLDHAIVVHGGRRLQISGGTG